MRTTRTTQQPAFSPAGSAFLATITTLLALAITTILITTIHQAAGLPGLLLTLAATGVAYIATLGSAAHR